jgi:hypothetical protein
MGTFHYYLTCNILTLREHVSRHHLHFYWILARSVFKYGQLGKPTKCYYSWKLDRVVAHSSWRYLYIQRPSVPSWGEVTMHCEWALSLVCIKGRTQCTFKLQHNHCVISPLWTNPCCYVGSHPILPRGIISSFTIENHSTLDNTK